MPRVKVGQPVVAGRKPRGFLVVVEGMDGTGKSTLAFALEESLVKQGVPAYRTREPTTGPFGCMLRERQGQGARYTPWEEYWLFMLDRVEHGREIRKQLAEGVVVISDRYWHSTWVYQIPQMVGSPASTVGDSEKSLLEIMRSARGEPQDCTDERRRILVQDAKKITPVPDLLVILDLKVATAQERILKSRGSTDAFETEALLTQYRVDYQKLAKEEGGLLLCADIPTDVLAEEICIQVLARRELR